MKALFQVLRAVAAPAAVTGSFSLMYRAAGDAYLSIAPGVPDHGMVEVPVMPAVMWTWGVAGPDPFLLALWLLSFMVYALPAAIGVCFAWCRFSLAGVLLALSVVITHAVAVIYSYADQESRFHAEMAAQAHSVLDTASLLSWGLGQVLLAITVGALAGAAIRLSVVRSYKATSGHGEFREDPWSSKR